MMRRMTAAAEFIAQLQSERRGGNVSGETEQHLKHEFRKLGRDASDLILSAAVGSRSTGWSERRRPSQTSEYGVRGAIDDRRGARLAGHRPTCLLAFGQSVA